jgi:galactosamine-6-phosphate isomerase
MLNLHIFADHDAMSRRAADWLAGYLRVKASSLLCLATGSTPTRSYELLAERQLQDPRLLSQGYLLKLDEWGGLAMDDPASCESYLRQHLVDPLGLHDRYVAFQSRPASPASECARIAAWLRQNGPIDVCVLGLGLNGHLGFNEPAPFLQPHAHVAQLSQASLSHAMLDEARGRPTFGLTLGLADLLQARQILLLVSGHAKRAALHRLELPAISTDFPASFLHLHPSAHVLCDSAAAADLADQSSTDLGCWANQG